MKGGHNLVNIQWKLFPIIVTSGQTRKLSQQMVKPEKNARKMSKQSFPSLKLPLVSSSTSNIIKLPSDKYIFSQTSTLLYNQQTRRLIYQVKQKNDIPMTTSTYLTHQNHNPVNTHATRFTQYGFRNNQAKENGEMNKESTQISKFASPEVYKPQETVKKTKRRRIQFSNVNLKFPDNQGSKQEQKPSRQSDGSVFKFKIPNQMQNDLNDSFKFAPPSPFEYELQRLNQGEIIVQKGQKEKLKSSMSKSNQGQNMYALQKILMASFLYDNYLKKGLLNKKQSFDLPQIDEQVKEKLPRQFFFKPQRILFDKPKDDLSHDYNYNGYHIICKVNEDRTKFYYQDLKLQQLYNMRGLKCSQITFARQLKISKNVQYDNFNQRFYLFSNQLQKLLVYSFANQELLCEVKVQKKVFDPHLFIHTVNNRIFLLIIGGYSKIQKNIVQGSKFIQIFQLMRWEIQLKSKIIKLITGRISPIILKVTQKDQNRILILGGNTIAKINKHGELNYNYEKDMNQSTNLTGLSISSHQIIELFDIKEQAICYNHSIKHSNPLALHDGCVVPVNSTHLLLLPGSKNLFQVKMFNKQVNIIQGKVYPYLPEIQQFQRRQICLRIIKEGLVVYWITSQGFFQIITQQDKIQSKCYCLIY